MPFAKRSSRSSFSLPHKVFTIKMEFIRSVQRWMWWRDAQGHLPSLTSASATLNSSVNPWYLKNSVWKTSGLQETKLCASYPWADSWFFFNLLVIILSLRFCNVIIPNYRSQTKQFTDLNLCICCSSLRYLPFLLKNPAQVTHQQSLISVALLFSTSYLL